ncbi:unnamed protein product, partial [Didymodactylos carnosus]
LKCLPAFVMPKLTCLTSLQLYLCDGNDFFLLLKQIPNICYLNLSIMYLYETFHSKHDLNTLDVYLPYLEEFYLEIQGGCNTITFSKLYELLDREYCCPKLEKFHFHCQYITYIEEYLFRQFFEILKPQTFYVQWEKRYKEDLQPGDNELSLFNDPFWHEKNFHLNYYYTNVGNLECIRLYTLSTKKFNIISSSQCHRNIPTLSYNTTCNELILFNELGNNIHNYSVLPYRYNSLLLQSSSPTFVDKTMLSYSSVKYLKWNDNAHIEESCNYFLHIIERCLSLTKLTIRYRNLRQLLTFQLRNITDLILLDVDRIPVQDLEYLSTLFPNLLHLTLRTTSLKSVIEKFSKLISLSISGFRDIQKSNLKKWLKDEQGKTCFVVQNYKTNNHKVDICRCQTQNIPNNAVIYPKRQDIYNFTLTIGHALSMGIWNDERKTYDPVLYDPNTKKYRARKYSLTDRFDAFLEVTNQSDFNTIITAAGLHRNMLLINKRFPGTPIVVPLNAKVEVVVTNEMIIDVLSLH